MMWYPILVRRIPHHFLIVCNSSTKNVLAAAKYRAYMLLRGIWFEKYCWKRKFFSIGIFYTYQSSRPSGLPLGLALFYQDKKKIAYLTFLCYTILVKLNSCFVKYGYIMFSYAAKIEKIVSFVRILFTSLFAKRKFYLIFIIYT